MVIIGNNELLHDAYELAVKTNDKNKIGLMQEHTLHRVLKFYYSLDESNHEIKVGKMFADVMINNHIYEIQTKAFNAFRDKLKVILESNLVTVVYPIAENKVVELYDEYGELVSMKKSPRHGKVFDLIVEQYKIKQLLNNPNLSFEAVMLDITEQRVVTPKKGWHSKGFERTNQIPNSINKIYKFNNKNDYIELLKTYNLPDTFTSTDFQKITHVLKTKSSTILNVLTCLDVVKRVDKKGNSYIYQIG